MNDSPTPTDNPELNPHWYRPTISHLMYAVAVLSAAVVAFGAWGLAVGAVVVLIWAYVYSRQSRPKGIKQVAIAFVLLGLLPLLLPIQTGADIHGWTVSSQCEINLKHLALALHSYHDDHGCFPPPYTTDVNGKPMHSWRALLLPYLQSPTKIVYRYDQPWDSPHNLGVAQIVTPYYYDCPQHDHSKTGHTSYFAVVGPNTIWSPGQSAKLDQITDGTEFTLMLIEDPSWSVLYTEPTDLPYAEAIQLLSAKDREGMHSDRPTLFVTTWVNGVFADGSAQRIRQGARAADVAKLWQIDDGREASETAKGMAILSGNRRRVDASVGMVVFCVFTILPLAWVWRPKKPMNQGN